MTTRDDLRNIAIVAHVDHGKTTLVDAMLWQTGAFRKGQDVAERVMDSMDLEREKGITILAKNTAINHDGVKLNIVDTPGHADFGGEVERGLTMVDGVLLLVDASEGPLPQTRFVLRKALEAKLPVILVVNKVDRPDARIAEVVDEVYELFIELDADSEQIDFPIVYTNAKAGWASLEEGVEGTDLSPLLDLMLEQIPAPEYDPDHPFQAHVTNLDADPYVGRLALCRVRHGTVRTGQPIAWCRADGSIERAAITELYITEALSRVAAEEAGPGEIIAVAGLPEVTIGETLADPEDPRPLPVITVDEPSLSIVVGINTSPLAGTEGQKLTARQIQSTARRRAGRQRLDPGQRHRAARRLGGPGPRRAAAGRPAGDDAARRLRADRGPAAGDHPRDRRQGPRAGRAAGDRRARGTRRRRHPAARRPQGAPRPHVQPRDRLGADGLPDPGPRPDRPPHRVPDRDPRHGDPPPRLRPLGAVGRRPPHPSDRFARRRPSRLERRATRCTASRTAARCSSAPGEEVYEGMIVGENARSDDLDVNAIKEKQQTNMRAASADVLVRLSPPKQLSLESALEFLRDDECLEITPDSVRLRKVELDKVKRQKTARSKTPA